MNDQSKLAKWSWRLIRWGLIALAILVALLAALIIEENWRGKRDWNAYQRAAAARGEHFDWSFLVPASVPDDQNFLKAPIFDGLTNLVWNARFQDWQFNPTNGVDLLDMSTCRSDGSSPSGDAASWQRAKLTRLEDWQNYYRQDVTNRSHEFPLAPQPQSPADDVLLALRKYDPVIEGLRHASQRPYSRLGKYGCNTLDDALRTTLLARFKSWARVIQLRAIAELAAHQNVRALEEVQLLLRLADLLRQEPLLLDHLVSEAITAISLQPVYEGLAQNSWNDDQLAELEQALAAKDFPADFQLVMRGEQVFAIATLENQRITGKDEQMYIEDGKPATLTFSLWWTPGAVFYRNELASARLNEELLLPLVDRTNRVVSPAALRRATASVNEQLSHSSLYDAIALMRLPGLYRSVTRFAIAQTDVDLARVACALERYHLAHGEYPAALDDLATQFISPMPHDVINGQPLRYRRTADGKFVLYSVGWNETDDGGIVALAKNGALDHEHGDWVWQYPAR
jgi:hypothetical protein